MHGETDWAGIEFCESPSLSSSALNVEALATGWSNQLGRKFVIDLQATELLPLTIECLSIRLQSKLPATIGFTFPEAAEFVPQVATAGKAAPAPPRLASPEAPDGDTGKPAESLDRAPGASPGKRRTRIAPPADLVKLEDRLYFVLQPPLETLVSSSHLSFPFEPFPYQLEGIAFAREFIMFCS